MGAKDIWTALGVALVLALVQPMAAAQGVPAGFDCSKASQVVERLVCAQAALRWQDLALSRAYRAARNAVTGAARDELLASQRDWLRDRDRRCVADRTLQELSDGASELGQQASGCLTESYLGRRVLLLDRAAPPLVLQGVQAMDLGPVMAARPEIIEDGSVRIPSIRWSPDGALAAVFLPSLTFDQPDQVWLYRVVDGAWVAASPAPVMDVQGAHPPGSLMVIQATAWQGGTLYVQLAVWGKDADGERADRVVYAATMAGYVQVETVPDAVSGLLDAPYLPEGALSGEVLPNEPDHIEPVLGNGDFLVWANDPGRGTISLHMRSRAAGAASYLIAWGGWNLAQPLLDGRRSQLVYAGDAGFMRFDLARRTEQRIAGTSQGDWLYALSPDGHRLAWATRYACGDERMTQPDEQAPLRFCTASLP